MQCDLGRIDMVRWQGRRPQPEHRARDRLVRAVVYVGVVAALSLTAGFYSGLPVPIPLLQTAAAAAVLAVLGFAAWTLTNLATHRGDRARISGYRRQRNL